MPITKGAKKTLRGDARKRVFNLRRASAMKSALKDLKKKVEAKSKKEAQELLPKAYKAIDKATKRGIIKPNTASRKKAQAARLVKNIE
ncbi:30S ribosomal protein S20 [bacterium]|nr:30S ribosomal protein S20 [bacterium]|tara:strand:+ start:2842 stop:3105 length:264 start_codon:yes stop_codon:yes gene_type:complete